MLAESRVAVRRILILLAAYQLTRVLFLVWNWNLFSQIPAGEILKAFVIGFRFDLSVIALVNSVVFGLWLLPSSWWSRGLSRLEWIIYGVVNSIALGSNIVDAEFVKFIGKRTAFDMLFLQQDLEQQGFSVLMTYWYFLLAWLTLSGAVMWLSPRFAKSASPLHWSKAVLVRVVALAVWIVAARGGFQFKPLHPMHAYFSTRHQLGLLALNTPFNVIKTRPRQGIERQKFFATDREAILKLQELTDLSRPPLALAKQFNVVILIVESLASEYVGAASGHEGYTPFLDKLASESYFFRNNLANGRRSIEGLPAVICGVPAIMAEPVITSDFANDRFDCLPHILGQRGYQTYFLHGAHNGSMHFDTFSRIAGFENFVGLNEYPKDNPEDFDKYWGVLDEPMLQYATKVLDDSHKPALITVFTLSSHHPYYIPEKYKGKFPKGHLEIHESIGYADYAIEQFFATAKTKPWFKNTIFVITGDHTQKVYYPEFNSLMGAYRVPLFVFVPGITALKFDKERITQHIDVMPTILDLLGIQKSDRLLVGQSVFDLGKPGRAYSFDTPEYWWFDDKLHIRVGRSGAVTSAARYEGGMSFTPDAADPQEVEKAAEFMKAVGHYLNEGLLRNNLYDWRHSL